MSVEKLVQKLGQEAIQKSLEIAKTTDPAPAAGGETTPFKDLLQSLQQDDHVLSDMGISAEDLGLQPHSFGVVSGEGIGVESGAMQARLTEPGGIEKALDFLHGVNDIQGRMDAVVSEVLYSGKQFSMQELLAIQAFVHHATQVTELTVKVFDHGTSSLRQVYQTQV